MTYALVLLATAVPKSSKGKSQSLASAILKDSYSNSSTLHNDEEDDDNSEQESDSIENSVYCVYDNFDETEGKNMVSIMLLLPSGLLLPTHNLKYKINDSFYHAWPLNAEIAKQMMQGEYAPMCIAFTKSTSDALARSCSIG